MPQCAPPLFGDVNADGSVDIIDACGHKTTLAPGALMFGGATRAAADPNGSTSDFPLLDACSGKEFRGLASEVIAGTGAGFGPGSHGKHIASTINGEEQMTIFTDGTYPVGTIAGFASDRVGEVIAGGADGWEIRASFVTLLGVRNLRLTWTKIGNGLTVRALVVVWGCLV